MESTLITSESIIYVCSVSVRCKTLKVLEDTLYRLEARLFHSLFIFGQGSGVD